MTQTASRGRDLAKYALRRAMDVVKSANMSSVAAGAKISYALLYAYADVGRQRIRGVRDGRPARKNSPSPERMREIAEAIRAEGHKLLDAADELMLASYQVDEEAGNRVSA